MGKQYSPWSFILVKETDMITFQPGVERARPLHSKTQRKEKVHSARRGRVETNLQ